MPHRFFSRVFAMTCAIAVSSAPLQADPDVLVLGDSQVSTGAGSAYLDFFNNLPRYCEMNNKRSRALRKLGARQTAAIGVSSTSLENWTARDGRKKGMICDRNERFGVNAGAYGIGGNNRLKYIQIGEGPEYQFCEPGKSAFESALAPGYYAPKLLVLAFLGNSAERWSSNPAAARQDVQNTISQIPRDMPCVFLTTAPVYLEATNDMRIRAQDEILRAFVQTGWRCELVGGLHTEIRSAVEGRPEYFRTNEEGEVTDPVHPKPDATRMFVQMNAPELCEAVFSALE